jgi:AcrR family transcriptional regulator
VDLESADAAARARPGRPRNPETERAVLDATLRQLAAVGYAQMSVDRVAAEAGTTKPTIYRRWPGKEALAIAALAHLQAAGVPQRTGDTRADLRAVLRDFRTKLLRPNGMAMIGTVLAEEARIPELIRLFRERIVSPRRAALLAILEAARDRGELARAADLDAAVNMLIGSFYAKYLTGDGIPADWPARAAETILAGCRAPRRPGRRPSTGRPALR